MKSKLLLILLACVMFMCNHENEPDIPVRGHVSFGVSPVATSAGRSRAEELDQALITIETASGHVVFDGPIRLTTFGDRYISEQLELGTGEYKLTRFILSGSGKAKYASPLANSPMAHLVEHPLPIEFSIQHNAVTTLLPEVVAIADASPGQFGYVEFGFKIMGEGTAADIYVVGFARTTKTGKSVAKLWKNGKEFDLTDGSLSAAAHKVIVVGNDVYVVGGEGRKAVMWKNGTPTYLTDGTDNAAAFDIVVSGTDIYICGSITRQHDIFEYKQAVYWKNNELIPLSPMSVNHSRASAIAVNGNDVYVVGTNSTGPYYQAATRTFGTYWKNGQEFPLTSQGPSQIGIDLAFQGQDMILITNTMATTQNPTAYHPWLAVNGTNAENVNGVAVYMRASDLDVAGEEVYVAGASFLQSGKAYVMIHKGGLHVITAAIQLPAGDASNRDTDAFAVTAHGSDIYICGKEWNPERAVYWKVKKPKEGMPAPAPEVVYLSDPAKTPVAYAYSIFVKEK